MHHRGLAAGALTLVLAATATACTSGDDAEPEPSGSTPELEGAVPTTGWWCRLIDEEIVDAATDGRTDEAREVLRRNDDSGFTCEIVLPTGEGQETEPVLSLTIDVDDAGAVQEARAEADADGAVAGPDYLGESTVRPGRAVAVIPCGTPPGSPQAGATVAHVLSLEAFTPGGLELTDLLAEPVRRSVVELDQGVGCQPSTRAADPYVPLGDQAPSTG